jgi:antitoxin (DNA-binding transcriptional repressor) of toxin-antitoxin stability system
MATGHISESEAARDFVGVMARVRAGEAIVIEAEARPIALITPTAEPQGRLLSECLRLAKEHAKELGYSPTMDVEYAADMEEIIRDRRPADHSVWD